MDDIKSSDLAEYAYYKKKQKLSLFLGVVLPAFIVTTEYFGDNDKDLPQVLNNEQAKELCRTESFENTSRSEKGFHINLSKPEIDTCAHSKIEQSEQTQATYIEEREDDAWKPYALAGAWSVAGLLAFSFAFRSNRHLREEKPGIEKIKYSRNMKYSKNMHSPTPDP